jgi:hypothetical protein
MSHDENGGVTQVQGNILIKDLFVDTAILFQHESVIAAADQQYLPDAFWHQQVKRRYAKINGMVGYPIQWAHGYSM